MEATWTPPPWCWWCSSRSTNDCTGKLIIYTVHAAAECRNIYLAVFPQFVTRPVDYNFWCYKNEFAPHCLFHNFKKAIYLARKYYLWNIKTTRVTQIHLCPSKIVYVVNRPRHELYNFFRIRHLCCCCCTRPSLALHRTCKKRCSNHTITEFSSKPKSPFTNIFLGDNSDEFFIK